MALQAYWSLIFYVVSRVVKIVGYVQHGYGKHRAQAKNDLEAFLNDKSEAFVT